MKIVYVTLLLLLPEVVAVSQSIKFINGKVWNGKEFIVQDFLITGKSISFKARPKPDSVIDLKGKFVVPPYAEGHNHNLEGTYELDKRIRNYVEMGVFYVKIMSGIKKRFESNLVKFNNPFGPDVSYAFAPITATGGHPIRIREQAFSRGDYQGIFNTKEELNGQGYFIVDSESDVDKIVAQAVSEEPDFMKVMILNSEEFEKRKDNLVYFGFKGLNPALVGKIVEKARKNHLHVSAHVETAWDFHVAIENNVDEVAHLPCLSKPCVLNEEDVKLTAKKKTVVTSTISLINRVNGDSLKRELFKSAAANLSLLKKHGVRVCIGSDNYYDNSINEFKLLHSLKVFSNEELLNMWFETAGTSIFPSRKIGKIKDGFEASFLILNTNPAINIESVTDFYLKVKDGVILSK